PPPPDCGVDSLSIEVADTGAWRPLPADPGNRGRGIAMMRALTDHLDIDSSGPGTRVRMSVRLLAVSFSAAGRM
ncbi:ATP-binding protein, partial [Nocardia seriolae]|uniref:ATP-binding protein n=2 Tax=Nocardia seriolae TaxID=37332 RepID=UPI001E380059